MYSCPIITTITYQYLYMYIYRYTYIYTNIHLVYIQIHIYIHIFTSHIYRYTYIYTYSPPLVLLLIAIITNQAAVIRAETLKAMTSCSSFLLIGSLNQIPYIFIDSFIHICINMYIYFSLLDHSTKYLIYIYKHLYKYLYIHVYIYVYTECNALTIYLT
jgi:hypothetical protein